MIDFIFLVLVLGGLPLGAALILMGFQGHADHMRKTYEIFFPKDMTHDQVLAFVRSLSGLPGSRFIQYPVVFEIYADSKGRRNFIHVPTHLQPRLDDLLEEHIKGISVMPIPDDEDPVRRINWQGVELDMWGSNTQLRVAQPGDVAASIRSAFRALESGEAVVLQWLITKDRARAATEHDKLKVSDHTFHALARIGGAGKHAQRLIQNVYGAILRTNAPGSRFIRRPMFNVPERIRRRTASAWPPIFLNALEFSALMGWPLDGSSGVRSRPLAPNSMIDTKGIGVAVSDFPKTRGRPLAITPASLMMHTWILGPSGVGKSTLLHNMAAQIMNEGMGLVLIEPKGDLARDVLGAVPKHRKDDVIWFDPSDTAQPIGLNVLAGHDPERITSHIVGMFHNLYSDAWGSRLERIMKFAIKTAAMNGLTLYDVRHLLINEDFRQREVAKIRKLDRELYLEWQWLDKIHDTAVDSVINKLDSFLGSRTLRNIVGQTGGLSMADVVENRKILLVPLPSALIGQTNTSALGSLVRELLWDEIRRRPADRRQPIILMMDEFQNYADLNTTRSDPFAEARSYGLGLIIANQHTGQLSNAVFYSVANNTASKIVFGLEAEDGKKLKDYFAPLTAEELAVLPRYAVATRLMTSTGKAPVATGVTVPPPLPTGYGEAALAASRARYGRPAAEVEQEFAERHKASQEDRRRPTIGRREE